MKNDKAIADALGMAARLVGSNAELGRRVGIHGSTLGKYRSLLIDAIADDHWEKLYPALKPWLPRSLAYWPASLLAKHPQQARGADQYTADAPAFGELRDATHPCDGKPPWLRQLCEVWDSVPEEYQNAVQLLARTAIEKGRAAQTAARKAPARHAGAA